MSRCSDPDADEDQPRYIGWSGQARSAENGQIRLAELTKLVAYFGNLLLDGEFDSPPPPPNNLGNSSPKSSILHPVHSQFKPWNKERLQRDSFLQIITQGHWNYALLHLHI
jgi:hypothetical protein